MATERIRIEVVVALPGRPCVLELELDAGTTACQALEAGGLAEEARALGGGQLDLGVWGRAVSGDRVLADGDRLECYRPLRVDPREARRRRASRR